MGMGNAPVIILREGTKRDKGKDAQFNNIQAAMAISNAVKSSLGPRGMDKMLVDSVGDDDGQFSPERAGCAPALSMIKLCYSGKYSYEEMRRKIRGRGGMYAHLGVSDCRVIEQMIKDGDEHAALILDAQAYQIAKTIGLLSIVLKGDCDAIILTKTDGDTRGGAAISIRSVVNKPLKFISSGEKMDALQVFHPERMADRILGMGDVVSLVERAQEQFDEEEARKLKKKLVKNQFNFNDFISQIQQIKKMGNLKDLASMLPGMGKMLKNVDIPDDVFKQTEAIISSMTPAEREHPEIINARRRERIAKGSGTTMADVNRLMKQFDDTRKMMKAVAGGGMKMPKMPGGMMRR